MSKLITRKIRQIETNLADATKLLRMAQTRPATDTEVIKTLRNMAADYEGALEREMDRSPEELSRDCMPVEVATNLLSSPLARITAPMRRACKSARETHYVSVIQPVPGATKLASRFSRAKLSQLGKWLRRCIYRRYRVQKGIDAIKGTDDNARKLRAYLEMRAAQFDITRAQLEAELRARSDKAGSEVGFPLGYADQQLTGVAATLAPEGSFIGRALRKFTRLFSGLGGPVRQSA